MLKRIMLLKKFIDVFKQCKQSLDNKNCNYRQFYVQWIFTSDLMNQSNNK